MQALKVLLRAADALTVNPLPVAAYAGHVLTLVPIREQVVVLALLVGSGVWASVARTRLALVALGLCAAMWLRANSQMEGAVLITVTAAHGLTMADLLVPSLGALALAARRGRAQAVPNRARDRAIARSRSTSRSRGGTLVTR